MIKHAKILALSGLIALSTGMPHLARAEDGGGALRQQFEELRSKIEADRSKLESDRATMQADMESMRSLRERAEAMRSERRDERREQHMAERGKGGTSATPAVQPPAAN